MTCPPWSIAVYNEKSHRYTTFFYALQELKVAGYRRIPDCKVTRTTPTDILFEVKSRKMQTWGMSEPNE